MKVTLEGHAWEIAAFLGRQSAPKSFGEEPPVLPPPLVPPPPSQPGPGRYLNGTRVEMVGGVATLNPELYKLPEPGGDLGWNDVSVSLYVV